MTKQEFDNALIKAQPMLMSYAMTFTHDVCDASDLVQDVNLKALTKYESLADGNLLKWCYTIMYNTHLDNWRKASHTAEMPVARDDDDDERTFDNVGDEEQSPERPFMYEAFDLYDAIDSLSDKYKKTMIMYAKGYSSKEIAEACGVPLMTALNHVHQGKKLLRKYFNQ